jgi:hypothetical protein
MLALSWLLCPHSPSPTIYESAKNTLEIVLITFNYSTIKSYSYNFNN